jgi:hypothetical protein
MAQMTNENLNFRERICPPYPLQSTKTLYKGAKVARKNNHGYNNYQITVKTPVPSESSAKNIYNITFLCQWTVSNS